MSVEVLPRGKIAVTPVRTGPLPTTSAPSPAMSVRWPTSTPATSVIASSGPGVPSKGMPRARARGPGAAAAVAGEATVVVGVGAADDGPRAGRVHAAAQASTLQPIRAPA